MSTKPDATPVTDADRTAEAALRQRLAEARPDDGVVGEEEGHTGPAGAVRRWVIDPLDGTRNFLRGIPVWASLVALEDRGMPVVGVVSAPALGRRWWASQGEGAFADGRRVRVSTVANLADAQLSHDSIVEFEAFGWGEAALALERRCGRARGLGDFWSHVLVAEGAVDIAVEPEVALWDVAPLKVIVEEAGGRFSDLSGRPWAGGGSALSTNALLHPTVLDLFAVR